MRKFTSKDFRKNNYFLLYDMSDRLICYFDNFEELSKYTNLSCSQLVYLFNHSLGFINIDLQDKRYKLYTFV